MTRPSRSQMLFNVAAEVATRSTCSRLAVGALIVRRGRFVMSGYNGPPAGFSHCIHFENLDGQPDPPCKAAIHAEANALFYAAREGIATEGAEMYVTHSPCIDCAKGIIQAGITVVYYAQEFRSLEGLDLLESAGIETHYGPS